MTQSPPHNKRQPIQTSKSAPVAQPPAIVVTDHRPRITIGRLGGVTRVVIPGYNRRTLALAHAVISAWLHQIADDRFAQWYYVISAGDARYTCTTIDIHSRANTQVDSVQKTRLAIVVQEMRDILWQLCTPLVGARTYDISEEPSVDPLGGARP